MHAAECSGQNEPDLQFFGEFSQKRQFAADRQRLRINTKQMEAAVTGRICSFSDKRTEEGFGFDPRSEASTPCFSAEEALRSFSSAYSSILSLLDLAGSGPLALAPNPAFTRATPSLIKIQRS